MNILPKTLYFLSIVTFAMYACKTTDGTSTRDNKKEGTVVEVDTTKPTISGIGSIGGTTDVVEEPVSGMMAPLELNPNVRTGVLDNGMHYYIQNNGKPENRVELRLAVNAGSMQEEDNQRGLAHFVEHMAFNGTTNFKKNELINFLESTGVRFGADLNAYTSFDETVYMLQLPTDKPELVDKGLLVMSDWATGVAFEDEEIDKERGVIESEWRTGLGADERMREVYWPQLFYESRYANRLPIGTMDVIQNAPYERFRTFYKDWYRPNLMALIVVGDVDVEALETQVKEQFSLLENPDNPREKEVYDVPNHEETFVAVASDKEATGVNVQVLYKHEVKEVKTIEDYRSSLMYELYNAMLNDRFAELSQDKDAPFNGAFAGYGNMVRAKDMYFISAISKESSILESLRLVLTEHARLLQHGFIESELERQKASMLTQLEKRYNERDKTTSGTIAMQYVYHFLGDQPAMGAEKTWFLAKELIPTITLEELNQLAKNWITEENRSVIVTAPENESVKLPTEEEIRKVLEETKDVETEPYKDKFQDAPLLAELPKGSPVTDRVERTEDGLNITELTLTNGVKVILKPTEFQNDQILLEAFSPGGHSIYMDKDYYSANYAAAIVSESGIGVFDNIALDRKLSDKNVNLSPYISELYEGFSGNSSVDDFETMLQLVYAYATIPRQDNNAFERFVGQSKEQIKNILSNPTYYFYDQMMRLKFKDDIRHRIIPSEEDFDKIDFERALEIYNDRFADFSDFTFVLVGNFEVDDIIPSLEQYLGALPSNNREEFWRNSGYQINKEGQVSNLQKGVAPQCNVYMGFMQEQSWTREKAHQIRTASQILNIMVRENLREEKGGVYSPYVGGGMVKEPMAASDVTVIFQCAPEDAEALIEAVKEEVQDLQTNGPSEENFQKVLEIQRREYESNLEKNDFWLNSISTYYQEDRNPTDILTYDDLIEGISVEDIQQAAKAYLTIDKALILTVKPEAEASED